MDFIGKICPYCKTEFKEGDDIVVCSACEMPHHKECWIENKACTTFGCTGTILGADQYTEGVENKKFCSKCGTPLLEEQKFCPKCGNPADATGAPKFTVAGAQNQPQYQPPQYQQPQYQQPQYQQPQYQQPQYQQPQYQQPQYQQPQYQQPQYQQPTAYAIVNNADPDTVAFIQRNTQIYLNRFAAMDAKRTTSSWNWPAFLFGPYWFAYRKMYAIGAAYLGINFLLSYVMNGFLCLVLSVVAGIFGNFCYRRYMEAELMTAKSMDDYGKRMHIAKKGGVNPGMVAAFVGIWYVLMIIIAVITSM